MKKIITFIILLSFVSCKKENKSSSINSNLEYYDQVVFESYFDVTLIQGNENSIHLVGNQKTIEAIDFSVKDSVLSLKNKSKSTWLNPSKNKFKLYLTFQNLKKINANETCTISNQDTLILNELGVIFASKLNEANLKLKCHNFYYWNNHPCGGKLTLNGTCDYLGIWNFALMSVDAKNLISTDAVIENSSKGDCLFTIKNSIHYGIKGQGNIFVYGNPLLVTKDTVSPNSTGKFYLK